jgi:polar amino acid transport system ATP-binding protein
MIDVMGLCKAHGGVPVLRDVSLSVARGEVAAVMGPSGSGKSTLLRCLNGLVRFDRGTVQVAGVVVSASASEPTLIALRRKVGMVFQDWNLFAHLDVLGNVVEAPVHVLGRPRREALDEALHLLDRVGLAHRRGARPHELSGGQQQRVAIARALAMHPEVLLLDEPTSALDPMMAGEVMSVVAKLAESGQTMLLVSHDPELVRAVAHRVHVLSAGECVERGAVDEVFARPSHPTTQGFLARFVR